MTENYFGTINYQNNINVFNPEKNSFLSNNTYTNNTSFGASQTISNSNNSIGIEELPPMEEDIDHLKKFHLQNRNNIYHFNNLNTANNINEYPNKTRSYSLKHNMLTNKFQPIRNTGNFYMMNKMNNLKSNYLNQQNINVQKPPQRSLQSRYSSASENRYHFSRKLNFKPQFDIVDTLSGNVTRVNYAPINQTNTYTNNATKTDSNIKYYYNNNNNIDDLYSNKSQSQFSTPSTPNQNIAQINQNNIQNKQFEVRGNRFKQASDYGLRTVDVQKLQNNIQLVKINENNKSAQLENKNMANKLVSNFNILGNIPITNTNTNTNINTNNNVNNINANNYYQQIRNQFPVDKVKVQNYTNQQRLTTMPSDNYRMSNLNNINIDKQRNTFYVSNNNYLNSYFNIKNNPQMPQDKNQINFNQAIRNTEVIKKQPELAVVTKIVEPTNNDITNNNYIYSQFFGENNNVNKPPVANNNTIPVQNANNNININFIQNNINNINIKNQNDLISKQQKPQETNYIPEDIDKLINENLAQYLNKTQPNPTFINPIELPKPQPQQKIIPQTQNPKLVSAYRTSTNTVISNHTFNPQNVNKKLNNIFPPKPQTQIIQNNNLTNNYITYNNNTQTESERLTLFNDKIPPSENIQKKKDINVTYSDFDGSGYVKNYGGVSRPGKNSSGEQKTNQDALVCKTNINNIKDFNIFGVLDGHGPEGHYVSEFAAEFIPSQIINHPEIKALKDPQQIYFKLKENNCSIITQAFIAADLKLKTVDFDSIESGSTCCLIIHVGTHIICANSGDSRALVVFDHPGNTNKSNFNLWNVTPLSVDFKPEMPEERERIIMSGGVVEQMKDELGEGCGPYRVWVKGKDYPGLAMSRSIGDLKGKEVGVIPNPGILEYEKYFLKNDVSAYCHELVSQALIEWETNDNIVDDITAVVAFF